MEYDLKMMASNPYFAQLGIEYIGQQERLDKFPLDAFNDLKTGSTFLRRPEESIFDMVERIRQAMTAWERLKTLNRIRKGERI